jgi:hypothetical protein
MALPFPVSKTVINAVNSRANQETAGAGVDGLAAY